MDRRLIHSSEMSATGSSWADGGDARSAASTDAAAHSAADDTDARDRAPADSAAAGSRGQDDALTWYGDSAYGTGEPRSEIEQAGHRAVIKPKPVQSAGSPSMTAPSMRAPPRSPARPGQTRPLSATQTVTSGALCRDCLPRAACTTAKAGRTMVLHERDDLLRAARADWRLPPPCARTTGPTGPTSNAPSPRSPPQRAADQAALPRHHQEQRLAQAPHRRAEPAQPHRPRSHPR
jgi:hypothetical protein